MMAISRSLFLSNETTGTITDTYTQSTDKATLLSRTFIEDKISTDEMVLFIDCADDDSSTPTIKVEISLSFDEGTTWNDWTEIEAASAVAKEVQVSSYDKSWWVKNTGVKFRITKSGAGAVTHTSARWI